MDALKRGIGRVTVRTGVFFATRSYLSSCLLGDELPEGDYVFLEVEDEGAGIDPCTVDSIFDPFFSTKSEGRGLGLAALQGIVRSHGGALSVRTAVGEGACFRVLFAPSDKPFEARFTADVERSEIVRGETVLVVDDTESVREITSALLSRIGYNVVTASSGEGGIERLEALGLSIDWVVLDMRMPGMGGAESCVQMHQIRPDLPIILVSGDAGEDEVLKLTEDSHTTYLQKPYGLNRLLQTMHALRGLSREDSAEE
jgi:CheY-like chemotaxis protein